MIVTRKLRDLDVSAASGLVVCSRGLGERLHVVCDDELALAWYDADGLSGRVPLLPGSLPVEHKARKRAKPDLEALALVGDWLVAFGSGSRSNRRRAVAVDVTGRTQPVDLSPLYVALEQRFPELNVEGAAVVDGRLRLLQRGNGSRHENGVVELRLESVLAALSAGGGLDADMIVDVKPVVLPDLDGVPLGFTDGSPWQDGTVFAAAAEAGGDTYGDGDCAGSCIGFLDAACRVAWLERVDVRLKIEGVHAAARDGGLHLLLCADADDPSVPAPLLEGFQRNV